MSLVSPYRAHRAGRPQHRARLVLKRALVPLRRHYCLGGPLAGPIELLPAAARRRVGLEDASARGSRRIEIGPGPFPLPGYLHVDVDPAAPHLEALAPAHDLPFPDGWATEIVAVHILEHVHPTLLRATLREWHRILAPEGTVRVHVPNSPTIMRAYLDTPDVGDQWMLSGALLGQYCGPQARGPEDLHVRSDHQALFTSAMLARVLGEAGFCDVEDRTDETTDRHTAGWDGVVDRFSLVAVAHKPAGAGSR